VEPPQGKPATAASEATASTSQPQPAQTVLVQPIVATSPSLQSTGQAQLDQPSSGEAAKGSSILPAETKTETSTKDAQWILSLQGETHQRRELSSKRRTPQLRCRLMFINLLWNRSNNPRRVPQPIRRLKSKTCLRLSKWSAMTQQPPPLQQDNSQWTGENRILSPEDIIRLDALDRLENRLIIVIISRIGKSGII
jgi:hypothetical protein